MVAPTPVSAYLHSATMVKAGVYLIARLSPGVRGRVDFWRPMVVFVGLYTMVAAGLRAMRQTDLKLLLAMGTVSQLGLHDRRVRPRLGDLGAPVVWCCSPMGSTRRRRSWWSASSTISTARATPA